MEQRAQLPTRIHTAAGAGSGWQRGSNHPSPVAAAACIQWPVHRLEQGAGIAHEWPSDHVTAMLIQCCHCSHGYAGPHTRPGCLDDHCCCCCCGGGGGGRQCFKGKNKRATLITGASAHEPSPASFVWGFPITTTCIPCATAAPSHKTRVPVTPGRSGRPLVCGVTGGPPTAGRASMPFCC